MSFTTRIIAALIVLLPYGAFAEPILRAAVSPEYATIGDRLKYEITVDNYTGTLTSELPAKPPFGVINVKELPPENGRRRIVFTLAAFDIGRFELPQYTLDWQEGDQSGTAVSPQLSVEIVSVLKGNDKPADIEGAAEAKPDYSAYYLPLGIALLVLLAALLLFYYLKKRAGRPKAEPRKPVMPPYLRAFNALDAIHASDYYGRGEVKEYFTALSGILRRYLEEDFQLDTMEKTTTEIADSLPPSLHGKRADIVRILELCDMPKFAREVPPLETAEMTISDMRNLISYIRKPENL